jgi:hypothetical protein
VILLPGPLRHMNTSYNKILLSRVQNHHQP